MPLRAVSARKPAKLSKPLHRQLTGYAFAAGAAAAGALATSHRAEAQIVYTPVHEILEPGSTVSLDFNHDGITDVTIVDRITKGRSHSLTSARGSLVAIPGTRPYGGIARRYYSAAGAFRPGERIGSSRSFAAGIDLMCTAYLFLDYYFGSWMPEATNRYLGVRFTLKGKPHFGWVRMNTTWRESKGGIKALVTGYAYETRPATAIMAGNTGTKGANANPAKNQVPESSSKGQNQPTLGALALGANGTLLWRAGK